MSYLNVPPLVLGNGVQIVVSDNVAGGGYMVISLLDSSGAALLTSTGGALSSGSMTQAQAIGFKNILSNAIQYLNSVVAAG